MRKLGDQWIEVVDGKNHMVKAVEPLSIYDGKSINGRTCHGCSFVDEWDDDCTLKNPPCRISEHKAGPFIIKDLGVLNEDGCLTAPWDKALYPQVYGTTEAIWYAYAENYEIFMEAKGRTKQEAIDNWNRRA